MIVNKCVKCGCEKLIKTKVTLEKWINGKLIVVENVPAWVCKECGEKYFDAETTLKLDEYFYESVPEKIIEVPVFEYKEG
ncbi:type II toxin-antitoxin system MqsA family antitoxin [Thermoanaerobacter wiegelii]|uniref:type II toxin-antitoxin system MqsA family antitoxin n=1 Tax=Thermoanaerobacter wiegelii TaxID=46354 RepID=UPI00059FE05E|nr:type II toxin-antitoxin system MqsA family antitoxin [Thermoanaerobacter wiegelii]